MSAAVARESERVKIFELLGSGDDERVEAMLALYARLFPKYQHYVPRMRRRAQFDSEHRAGHLVHYWLIEVDGATAALRTFRYLPARRCGLAHALAVDTAYREMMIDGRRLSVYIIYECLAQIIRDADARGDPPPLGIVNEVEPDRLMDHYVRSGLFKLPLQYAEPIFPPAVEGRSRLEELALTRFSYMHVGFLPNPAAHLERYSREMITEFVRAFLIDHYGLPEDHPAVLEVIETIRP